MKWDETGHRLNVANIAAALVGMGVRTVDADAVSRRTSAAMNKIGGRICSRAFQRGDVYAMRKALESGLA